MNQPSYEEMQQKIKELEKEHQARKRAEAEMIKINRALEVIGRCNETLVHSTDENAFLNAICHAMVEVQGYTLVWVGLARADKRVEAAAYAGREEGYLKTLHTTWDESEWGNTPAGIAIKSGNPYLARDIAADPSCAPLREEALRRRYAAAATFPMICQGQTIGVLAVYTEEPGGFDDKETKLMLELAADLAYGVLMLRTREEHRQAEIALIESENRYRTLFNSASDAIFIYDLEGNFLEANQAACDQLGYAQERLLQMTALSIERPDRASSIRQRIKDVHHLGHFICETSYVREDGTSMPVELHSRMIEYRGRPAILDIARDISERKKFEERMRRSQKLESLGTLAGGIAHDFNNLLGAIIGYAEVVWYDISEDSGVKGDLQEILNAAHRAKDLVKQVLTFSRQNEPEVKPVQVDLIVREALKFLRASLPSTIEICENLESKEMVMGDPTQIHQIVMNLCTNSYHAMKPQGGILDVSLDDLHLDEHDIKRYTNLRPGHYLRLTVSDTGHGIDPLHIDRIFDPYFTTKPPGEGTGLGLAVVHGIVKMYGGEITVESAASKGTKFEIYLPILEREKPADCEMAERLPGGHERILLVDDVQTLVTVGKRMLQRLGYKVVGKTSSLDAMESFRARPENFDLIITDMVMPSMTGTMLATAVLRIRSDMPIILATGFSEMISREKARDIGFRELVMKPLVLMELARVVRKVLDESKLPPA